MVKDPPATAGDTRGRGSVPGPEDPLQEETATRSISLPGEARGQSSVGALRGAGTRAPPGSASCAAR